LPYDPAIGFDITPVAGSNLTCTLTNAQRPPTIELAKALPNGRADPADQFELEIRIGGTAGSPVVASGITSGSGTTASGGTGLFTGVIGAPYTLTERMAAGSVSQLSQYTSTITCSDARGVQTGLPNAAPFNPAVGVTITPVAGAAISCVIDNVRLPPATTLSLNKIMSGPRIDASDQFTVAIRTGGVNGTPVNNPISSTTAGSGSVVNFSTGTTGTVTGVPGTSYTFTEEMAPGSASLLRQYRSTITCADSNNIQPGLPVIAAAYDPAIGYSITPVSGAWISCTIRNEPRAPTITLNKSLTSPRLDPTDQFIVDIRLGGITGSVVNNTAASTTSGAGAVVTSGTGTTGTFIAAAGTPYTLVERIAFGSASGIDQYTGTITCTDSAGLQTGLPSGATTDPLSGFMITPVAGAEIVCTITNTPVGGLFGRVFLDTGIGGGVANDGIMNGGEIGQAGIAIRLTDCAGSVFASTLTGSAGEWSFASSPVAAGAQLCIEQANSGTAISTGASVAGTAVPSGTPTSVGGVVYEYDRTSSPDVISLAWATAASSNGIDFGDVPPSLFGASGARTAVPGSGVSYAHTFTAGTAGTVVFSLPSASATPANPNWSQVIFADPTCSGSLQPGAQQLFPPVGAGETVDAGDNVCIIVQQLVPADAPQGAINSVDVQADFSFSAATPSLSATYTLQDVTTVGSSALELRKEVRNVTTGGSFGSNNLAKPGDVLEYRITFTNNAAAPISDLAINDTTPAYSTFVSADVGALPAALTACVKQTPANPAPAATVGCSTTQPTGGTGPIKWTFTGQLNPGAGGSVFFFVVVQ
jgi:uncharacterized repeat protein (TIGR01451 family)